MKVVVLAAALLFAALEWPAPAAEFTVTAYCSCAKCCGESGRPTASGKFPRAGITVAGPRRLPFGTRIYIEGIGERTVEDRLALRFDNQFDLYFSDHESAKAFGKRKLDVRVLK